MENRFREIIGKIFVGILVRSSSPRVVLLNKSHLQKINVLSMKVQIYPKPGDSDQSRQHNEMETENRNL